MKQEDIHISFDLETLSLESNAAIVQIGAVQVGSSKEFNSYINPRSAEYLGGHVDVGTINWWDRQDPQIRNTVFGGITDIREALLDLAQEDEHHNAIADFKHKGKIGVRRPRDPIRKATEAEGRVTITIPFTPEEAKTVTGYLNRSNVPLSMPEALAALRLYFLGMVDEGHTRFMIG